MTPLPLTILTTHGDHHLAAPADLGQPLTQTLAKAGLPLNTRCAERGLCDGCLIDLLQGSLRRLDNNEILTATPPSPVMAVPSLGRDTSGGGRDTLTTTTPITLRACAYASLPNTPVTLRVPDRSLLAHRPQVVSQFKINIPFADDPLPTPPGRDLGVAIDIGTTTVAILLVDLRTGRILGRAADYNHQAALGDNVVTRINLCLSEPTAVRTLQRAVVDKTIVPLILSLLEKAKRTPGDVGAITAAANTTMLHLLIGRDPSPMGTVPFTPRFIEHLTLDADQLGTPLFAGANLHLLPGASAYVGADLCAGMLATGLVYDEGPSLLVDIGTNGEIILKHGQKLLGCATAAGPAFEGSTLTSGMRAADGAISHVTIDPATGQHTIEVIAADAGAKPQGICGSAYVDLLAQMRQAHFLTPTGRFTSTIPTPTPAPPPTPLLSPSEDADFLARLNNHPQRSFSLIPDASITLTERDIASLLQAKAAVAAGIITLLDRTGHKPADIKTLHLAGGFGLHLDIPNTIASGLLPGFHPDQIKPVGNTSLAGAYLALIDQHLIDEMQSWARCMTIIELNLDPQFEDTFIEHLSLP